MRISSFSRPVYSGVGSLKQRHFVGWQAIPTLEQTIFSIVVPGTNFAVVCFEVAFLLAWDGRGLYRLTFLLLCRLRVCHLLWLIGKGSISEHQQKWKAEHEWFHGHHLRV